MDTVDFDGDLCSSCGEHSVIQESLEDGMASICTACGCMATNPAESPFLTSYATSSDFPACSSIHSNVNGLAMSNCMAIAGTSRFTACQMFQENRRLRDFRTVTVPRLQQLGKRIGFSDANLREAENYLRQLVRIDPLSRTSPFMHKNRNHLITVVLYVVGRLRNRENPLSLYRIYQMTTDEVQGSRLFHQKYRNSTRNMIHWLGVELPPPVFMKDKVESIGNQDNFPKETIRVAVNLCSFAVDKLCFDRYASQDMCISLCFFVAWIYSHFRECGFVVNQVVRRKRKEVLGDIPTYNGNMMGVASKCRFRSTLVSVRENIALCPGLYKRFVQLYPEFYIPRRTFVPRLRELMTGLQMAAARLPSVLDPATFSSSDAMWKLAELVSSYRYAIDMDPVVLTSLEREEMEEDLSEGNDIATSCLKKALALKEIKTENATPASDFVEVAGDHDLFATDLSWKDLTETEESFYIRSDSEIERLQKIQIVSDDDDDDNEDDKDNDNEDDNDKLNDDTGLALEGLETKRIKLEVGSGLEVEASESDCC